MEKREREKRYRIIIWGLGTLYNRHLNFLKYAELNGEITVVAVTALEVPNINYLDEWRVIESDSLCKESFDYIVVMSGRYFDEIASRAVSLGIDREKIVPCRVMDIPYFNWTDYIHILESHVSIACNNCWGGILYHTLGLECLSPFKNLALSAKDLLHMLPNIKHYLTVTPQLVEWRIDRHSNQSYPVMAIDDIMIHFNHDSTVEEALEKWTRRCKKFNYDNIFVCIYTEDDDVVKRFLELNEYPNKVCFTPYRNGQERWKEENVFELDILPGQKEFWESVNSNVSNGTNSLEFDILAMLHMKKKYRVKR